MKFLYFAFLFLFFSANFINFVSAEIYRQHFPINFVEVVTVNGYPIDNAEANITIIDPDKIIIVPYAPMTFNFTAKTFNYTLLETSKTGVYTKCVYAYGNNLNATVCEDFEVTPSGKEQTSILENPLLLFFAGIGLLLILIGISNNNYWLGFLGSIAMIIGGVYTMIYGLNNEQTVYTQGLSVLIIGLGFVFMFISAYEWWEESREE